MPTTHLDKFSDEDVERLIEGTYRRLVRAKKRSSTSSVVALDDERFARQRRLSAERKASCEGAAHAALATTQMQAPADPVVLALRMGLSIEATGARTAMLAGNTILVWPGFGPQAFAWAVAHEVGHHVLRLTQGKHLEEEADAVAATLLGWTVEFGQRAFDAEERT